MNIHDQIDRAVAHAASPLERAKVADRSSSLLDLRDKDLVMVGAAAELPPDHVTVDVHTAHDLGLRALFKAFGDVTDLPLGHKYIDSMIRHENDHWQTYKALGAPMGRFAVKITRQQDPDMPFTIQPFTIAENFTTTKLGIAAAVAHPSVPSPGDIATLSQYGYSDILDVTRRIISHNDNNPESHYPVPRAMDELSVRKYFNLAPLQ